MNATVRRWSALAALALAAYLGFLAATLPAPWLGVALEQASGKRLALGAPAGTLWHGSGTLLLNASAGYRRVAEIEWHAQPSALLSGRLGLAISGNAPGARLRARLVVSPAGATLENVEALFPAKMVNGVLPVELGGELSVQSTSLAWRAERLQGSATVEWRHASLPGLQAMQLGDYRLAFTTNAAGAAVQLATLRGDLKLSAAGEWRTARPQRMELRGRAENTARRSDLDPLMALLGQGKAAPAQAFVLVVPIRDPEG